MRLEVLLPLALAHACQHDLAERGGVGCLMEPEGQWLQPGLVGRIADVGDDHVRPRYTAKYAAMRVC